MSEPEKITMKFETADGKNFEVPIKNWYNYRAEDFARMIAIARSNPNKFVFGGKKDVDLSED